MMSNPQHVRPDGMYSKLVENEAVYVNEYNPDVEQRELPLTSVRVTPWKPGPNRYRLATVCMAGLCFLLLIVIIAVATKDKGVSEGETSKQKQEANRTALEAEVSQLRQENGRLLAQLAAYRHRTEATRVPTTTLTTKRAVVIPFTPAATSALPVVCAENWRLFQGHCYYISANGPGTRRNWEEGQSYCRQQGGNLAIVQTAEEQTFLWDLLPRAHWNSYWIGVTDGHTEDEWKWVDGTPVIGGFWAPGEPNNHLEEDCVYIVKTRKMERVAVKSWYDAPCDMSLPFICEVPGSTRTAAGPQ